MKRVICLLLVSVLLCAAIVPASAANEETAVPYFNYIYGTTTSLDINEEAGIATCWAECDARSGVTIKIVGSLQQYKSSKWTEVYSWTTSGTDMVVLNRNRPVTQGYSYRFVATYYIYNAAGTLLESTSATCYP